MLNAGNVRALGGGWICWITEVRSVAIWLVLFGGGC